MNLGLVGAGGAKSGADALQDILKRKALEVQLQQNQAMKERAQALAESQDAESRRQFEITARQRQQQYDFESKKFEEALKPKPEEYEYVEVDVNGRPVKQLRGKRTGMKVGEDLPSYVKPTKENETPEETYLRLQKEGKTEEAKAFLANHEAWARSDDKPGVDGLRPAQQLYGTIALQKQWDTFSKDAREIGFSANRMASAWNALKQGDQGMTPAAAEAVQVLFQKILDPGSVVREGEFTRSMLTQPVIARMRGFLDRIDKGGTGIPIEELGQYVQLAQQLAASAQEDFAPMRSRFERTAKASGIDPTLIFTDDMVRRPIVGATNPIFGAGGAAGAAGGGAAGAAGGGDEIDAAAWLANRNKKKGGK